MAQTPSLLSAPSHMGAQSTFNGLIIVRFHLRCFKFYSMPNVAENGGQICDREIRFLVGPALGSAFWHIRITILDQMDVVLEKR